jgi:hypothetical protein
MMDSVRFAKQGSSAMVIVFNHAQKVDIVIIPKKSLMDYSVLMVHFQIKLVLLLQHNVQYALQGNIVWLESQQEHAMQVIFASMELIHLFLLTDWEPMLAPRDSIVAQVFLNP